MDTWELAGEKINSRLFLGTARYPSLSVLNQAIENSGTNVVTLSLRRESPNGERAGFWEALNKSNLKILPNTAGCLGVKEAITTAQMARELFDTNWIKLEVVGNDYTLQPDPIGLLEATRILLNEGFEVFPYTTDDLVIAEKLVELGCRIIMPWGSPIGSGKGLLNIYSLELLRKRLPKDITLVVDAGIGRPSDACRAMELGFDAVLLNSAVALSDDPASMALAFRNSVIAGRIGFESGVIASKDYAQASTPTVGKPFWHEAT